MIHYVQNVKSSLIVGNSLRKFYCVYLFTNLRVRDKALNVKFARQLVDDQLPHTKFKQFLSNSIFFSGKFRHFLLFFNFQHIHVSEIIWNKYSSSNSSLISFFLCKLYVTLLIPVLCHFLRKAFPKAFVCNLTV